VSDPFSPVTVSRNDKAAYAVVHFSTNPQQLGQSYLAQIGRAVQPARSSGVDVYYGGTLGQAAQPKARDARSELIGITVALLVLVVAFGSLYAAGLPLVSAALGTFTGLGALGMVTAAFTFPTVPPTLAIMMGPGVGIDYALFLTTRHRQYLTTGTAPQDAAALALATSGRAVLIAATTVVIAMLGLYALGIGFIGDIGAAGALAVAVAGTAALTLAPALLAKVGGSIDRVHLRQPRTEASASEGGWGRYVRSVGKHPWRYLVAGLTLL